jgi:hypothetical protein
LIVFFETPHLACETTYRNALHQVTVTNDVDLFHDEHPPSERRETRRWGGSILARRKGQFCNGGINVEMRGVAAGRMSDPTEVAAWMNKWGSALSKQPFAGAEYLAFVPTQPGQIVVIPNDGRYVKEPTGRIALANDLVDALNRPRGHDRFGLAFLL